MLTTIFAILGPPLLSVAFPLWVKSADVPICLSRPEGAPVYLYCLDRALLLYDNPQVVFHLNSRYLLNDDGGGVFSYTLPLEHWGINQADQLLEQWASNPPGQSQVHLEQFRISSAIFAGFQFETTEFINTSPIDRPVLPSELTLQNHPNPFNDGTLIHYSAVYPQFPVIICIYDLLGRKIAEFAGTNQPEGTVYWSGKDSFGNHLSSGVYPYTINNGPIKKSNTMILLK
jgi:hypothetical protein